MDRIAAILRFQWRAYWRRFQRKGNLTTNNAGVWLLFGGIGIVRYLQQLPGVASQIARGETKRFEALLLAVFLVWMFPVMGETWRSISSRSLLHTPLTSTHLYFLRLCSVFVSPASWVVGACSLALVYPIAKAAHPLAGLAALLLFVLFSFAMSLTIAHALTSAYVRKILLGAVIVVSALLGAFWFASGKAMTWSFAWWPNQLVAGAAVTRNRLVPVAVLTLMTVATFGLSFWSFIQGLESGGTRRSQRFAVLRWVDFPGRFRGLLKKDLRYFMRLLDVYFTLPVVILFIYYLVSTPEPSAAIFRVVVLILFLPCMSLADNLFGLDSPNGLDRYALFPLSGRDILLSKNLALAMVLIILSGAIFPFALWRFGVGLTALGIVELLLVGLAYLSWGNWMSVRQPYRMQFYRFSAGGSPADAVIGVFFGSVPGVIMIYLLYREDTGVVWKMCLMMVAYFALYYASLTRSGHRFEERLEAIREL